MHSKNCLKPNWPCPPNIEAFTTLRNTQLSSLNLPAEPVLLNQVHGNKVIIADEVTATLPTADASYTAKSKVICAVKTADCLPLLICDMDGTQVAAIHAGWRGLAAGVISSTCKQFKSPMRDCLVWLGPSIGPQAFEVGQDVLDGFRAHGWAEHHIAAAFSPSLPGKWLGNLCALAKITLQQQGVPAENIYGGEWCTYSDTERFYSYRRSQSDLGRMLSLIWIK